VAVQKMEKLDEALEINRRVFGESGDPKYRSKERWIKIINENCGRIYVESGEGFLFCYHRELQPRELEEDENTTEIERSEHIWLAGVVFEARNRGIMKKLFRTAVAEMVLPLVTIRTGSAFPEMESWIKRLGFHPRVIDEATESTLYEISLTKLKKEFDL
jgi:hypothetical protein